jgi:hypothetical protein
LLPTNKTTLVRVERPLTLSSPFLLGALSASVVVANGETNAYVRIYKIYLVVRLSVMSLCPQMLKNLPLNGRPNSNALHNWPKRELSHTYGVLSKS